MTPARARTLLAAAEPHLHGCEIMAARRPEARADWTPVRDLAQAAPDLAQAYLASEGRLAFLVEVGGASGWCDLHPRRVEAGTAGMIGRDTTDGADVCLACEVRRLEAERDELRLILLAEQGDPAGAPSGGWRWNGGSWWVSDGKSVTQSVTRYVTSGRRVGWLWLVAGLRQGHAPTAREAMIRADEAAGAAAEGGEG